MKSFPTKEISARFHVGVETVHPFSNGNGRFGIILTDQICRYHTFEVPTWGKSLASQPKERRKSYINALIHARREHDFAKLINVMFG